MSGRKAIARMLDSSDGGVELHLVMLGIATLTLLGLAAYVAVVHPEKFSLGETGQALGILFGGWSFCPVGQGLQRKFQPPCPCSEDHQPDKEG